MREGDPNNIADDCFHCGRRLGQGEGRLVRPLVNGQYKWKVECPDACNGDEPRGKREAPGWAVYDVQGLTPMGNKATGVALVDGLKPTPDAVPVNDVAKAMEQRR